LGATLVVGAVSAFSSGSASAAKQPPTSTTVKVGWTKAQERQFLAHPSLGFDVRCQLRVLERFFPTQAAFNIATEADPQPPEWQASVAQVQQECKRHWKRADEKKYLASGVYDVQYTDLGRDPRCVLDSIKETWPNLAAAVGKGVDFHDTGQADE